MKKLNLLLVALLCGCATSGDTVDALPDKAVLIVENDSSLKIVAPLAVVRSMRIEKVDGKKVSDFWNSTYVIELDPGTHSVQLSCRIDRGALILKNEREITVEAKPGNKHIFSTEFGRDGNCTFNERIVNNKALQPTAESGG